MKPVVSALRRNVFASSLVLAAIAAADPAGQGQGAAPRARQSFTSTSTAILVDVVVRDNHGRPVTDLSAADFDIAEDGVRQKIDSFSRVSHGGGIGVGVAWRAPRAIAIAGGAGETAEEQQDAALTPEEATTALVFDHLSAETLRLAQKATLDYVPMSGESNVQVGVFASDLGVRALQRYTNDRALVRRAVARVMPVGGSDEEQRSDRTDELIERRKAPAGEAESAGPSAAQGSGPVLAQNAGSAA